MTIENEDLSYLTDVFTPDITMEELVKNGCSELEMRLQESDTSMLSEGSSILPSAQENGRSGKLHITLDLGGSFAKMGFVNAADLQVLNCASMAIHAVSVNIDFFKFIVQWICRRADKFLREGRIEPSTVIFELGVTFGFPLTTNGQITTMGKGFQLSDEIRSVKITELLQRLFREVQREVGYRYEVRVRGIVNDSVAVYLANAATQRGNDVSLILGTGINACFSLASDRVPSRKCSEKRTHGAAAHLINSEIGFLGKDFIKLSEFDPKDETLFMPLEYVTAGKWIPLTLQKIIFRYNLVSKVAKNLEFDGKLICEILKGSTLTVFGDYQPVIEALTFMLIERAAFYATGAILSILKFTNNDMLQVVRVGYAGSFLRNCPVYKDLINKFSGGKIELEFLEHSNLIGAHVNSSR
ncbi:hexokinase LALA0_S03e08438g [Lachancea lanzarotensis]|uniref:Phosphotransferase n=1 Tax=Lachancea lanzarotensis TaxID=1245769 RepID=A0A0C7MP73_9SACH|nr:uncharacterized protein LALA0_S03e08438g [Lachancea lanzarotensis]CEP61682.1 LALA0S03e08438g1_1 [Lachancea lanzarotensis]